MKAHRSFLIFLIFCLIHSAACLSDPLPQKYFGDWCEKVSWTGVADSYSWTTIQITEQEIKYTTGEVSLDSGSRSYWGPYKVLSGGDGAADTYLIQILQKRCSSAGGGGYGEKCKTGQKVKNRVSLQEGALRFNQQRLERGDCGLGGTKTKE